MIKLNRSLKIRHFDDPKYYSKHPEELKFPDNTVVEGNVMDNEYFYRDQEMFRPHLDEVPE